MEVKVGINLLAEMLAQPCLVDGIVAHWCWGTGFQEKQKEKRCREIVMRSRLMRCGFTENDIVISDGSRESE
jgi:hypothetical protein